MDAKNSNLPNSGMTLGTCRHVCLFGVGANCVIGRRKKMIGFGQAVDLKILEKM